MKRGLVVVAHPDDETLFFGGLMASRCDWQWDVVCVTDGGPRRAERRMELRAACKALGVHEVRELGIPDVAGERLAVSGIEEALVGCGGYDEVYTHGPLGDYGNPHHQDVCLAVHRFFQGDCPVYSVSTAICPIQFVTLSPDIFELKSRIMTTIYKQEYERFMLVLPALPFEGFTLVGLHEVEALHSFLCGSSSLNRNSLEKYGSVADIIEQGVVKRSCDAFFAAYFMDSLPN